MSDAELIARWAAVSTLEDAVDEMLEHETFAASSDPYYRDLTGALWAMLARVRNPPKHVLLDDLELSVKTANLLRAAGVTTLAAAVEFRHMLPAKCRKEIEAVQVNVDDAGLSPKEAADRLRGLLEGWLQIYDNCTITHGVCCCGEEMETHSDPMSAGHSPTDNGTYQAGLLADETRKALSCTTPE